MRGSTRIRTKSSAAASARFKTWTNEPVRVQLKPHFSLNPSSNLNTGLSQLLILCSAFTPRYILSCFLGGAILDSMVDTEYIASWASISHMATAYVLVLASIFNALGEMSLSYSSWIFFIYLNWKLEDEFFPPQPEKKLCRISQGQFSIYHEIDHVK